MALRDVISVLATGCALIGCSHAEPTPTAAASTASFTVTVSGTGRPIVLLPDLEASGDDAWETTVAHLRGTYETHVIDIAGFAGSAPLPGPLVPHLRDDLAHYLHDHARGAILVGHMFGAELAYWLAMTEPDLVGGVIAIDAPPSRNFGSIDPEVEEGRQAMLKATREQFAMGVTRRLSSMVSDPERAKHLAAKGVLSDQTATADAFNDMMTRDLRPQIPNIRAPVLLLLTTGNLPADMLPEVQKVFGEQLAPIPHHELVVVPDSHHYVMFDAPDVFFANLDRFLAATGG